MTDHQLRQLIDALRGIDGSLAIIARALSDTETSEPTDVDINDAIERGRLFGRD